MGRAADARARPELRRHTLRAGPRRPAQQQPCGGARGVRSSAGALGARRFRIAGVTRSEVVQAFRPAGNGGPKPRIHQTRSTTMRNRFLLVAALTLSMAAPIALVAQAPVNVTGKWIFTVGTSAGSGMPTVTLKQDGEKLTGHYSSQNFGEVDLTGTVKGTAITFMFGADVQGTHLDVTYSGTVENKDSMKGKVNLGGVGEGTFTAKKQS